MVQKIDAVENFSEIPRKQLFKGTFFVKLQPLAPKRGVLKIFAGFTGKHLCWSPLNKVAGRPTGNASVFRLRALLKKETLPHDFIRDLQNIFQSSYVYNSFVPSAPFPYPLKTSEKLTVFRYFQGVEKGCIWSKWVKGTIGRQHLSVFV